MIYECFVKGVVWKMALVLGLVLSAVLFGVIGVTIVRTSEKKAIANAVEKARQETEQKVRCEELISNSSFWPETNAFAVLSNTNESKKVEMYYFQVVCECGNVGKFPVVDGWSLRLMKHNALLFKCAKCGKIQTF